VAASSSYFTGDNRPVEQITWFEARDFCALRDARLLTEAEWEYAARGPDGLIFPWGNTFVSAVVVSGRPSAEGSSEVGSLPAGASWVGALDLSGSVWEWIANEYRDYPYDAGDGREDINSNVQSRVIRGGAWDDTITDYLHSASRLSVNPDSSLNGVGFRCARSFE
jgi:iron(II)-dependent oxidoreductase